MTFPIPATEIEPRLIVAGPGRLYLGTYQTAGADSPSGTFLGASEGGVEIHYGITRLPIEVDQAVNAVEAVPTKEEWTIKTKLVQHNLQNLYKIMAQAGTGGGMTLSGGTISDVSSSLTIGEQLWKLYWQLAVQTPAPPGATGRIRVYQFWKAALVTIGAWKHEKTKEAGFEVTFRALTDFTITDATNRILKIYDA